MLTKKRANKKRSKEMRQKHKKINNFTKSNREEYNIAIAILGKI